MNTKEKDTNEMLRSFLKSLDCDQLIMYLNNTEHVNLVKMLRRDGYLSLHDVIEAMEKPEMPGDRYVGWVLDVEYLKGENK